MAYASTLGFYFMRDRARDPKHQNIEVTCHHRRKIGGGTAAEITSSLLSSFQHLHVDLHQERAVVHLWN
jgi:hypothetical protein